MQRLPLPVHWLLAFLIVTATAVALTDWLEEFWWGSSVAWLAAGGIAAVLSLRISKRIDVEIQRAARQLNAIEQSLETGLRSPRFASETTIPALVQFFAQIDALAEATSERVARLIHANRDLDRNQALLQSILETMIEGMLVLDAQERILFFNGAARRLLDCRSRDAEGRLVWEVVRAPDLHEVIATVSQTGADLRREIKLQRRQTIVEVTVTRLMLAPAPGLVVVLHDVTELRRLERLRQEFVSNVSHELKTPLTSIQAYADTLLEGGLEDSQNSRLFLTRILEQADRLQLLIQDMLRLARIESQSDAYRMQPVFVQAELETCIDARLAVAQARGIELKVLPGDTEMEVISDVEGLRTIVDNLVNNALNYTPVGGHVVVRTHSDGNWGVIEVEDDGIGISAEHRERIFERFFRVDKARSRGMGGTGLGLAIVKHLTVLFHGEIEVESRVGHGSLFRVRLPLAPQDAHTPT